MDKESLTILATLLYKLTSLSVGFLLSYLGYKLFMAGIWGNAGDLKANFKSNKLVLKNAAPGTFFVLFGAIVIAFTISEGIYFESKRNYNPAQEQLESQPKLPD